MQLNPYLNFNGQCETAFKFYEKCLGGKITAMLTFGSSPMVEQTPPEWHDKIMHARLTVGEAVLMASDAPPGHYEKNQRDVDSPEYRQTGGSRTHIRGIVGKWNRADANPVHLLGCPVWHAGRSVRHTVDGQL